MRSRMLPLALGIAMGCMAAVFAQMEARWAIFACLGLMFAIGFLAVRDKGPVLFAAFFLSFQIDVYLRPFFGAGGSAGLAVPLVSIVGMVLAWWSLLNPKVAGGERFHLAGSLRRPIIAMFATTLFSFALITSDHFLSFNRVLFELQWFGVYWVTLNLVRTPDDFRRVLTLLFLTLALQSIVYFVESGLGVNFTLTGETRDLGETPRPGGTVSSNPAGFTSFIMPILMVAIAFFVSRRPGMKVPWLALLILAGAASVGLSFTRAAWFGLGIGVCVIGIVAVRQKRLMAGRAAGVALVACACLLALLPLLLSRINSEYPSQSTLDERLNLIRISLNVIANHPLAGVGPGLYDDVFKEYLPPGLGSGWVAGVHNEFLLRTAETGVAGGIAFLWLVVAAFRSCARVVRSGHDLLSVTAIGWMGGLSALVWQMCWVPWRGFSYNAMFWVFLGLMDASERMLETEKTRSSRPV